MKKVLIVAYHFPPVGGLGAAGAQRVLKFARHLPSQQWQPHILTVRELCYDSYLALDPALLDQVPKSLHIARTGVLRGLRPVLRLKRRLRSLFRRPVSRRNAAVRSAPNRGENGDSSRYQKFKDAVTDLFQIPDEVAGWLIPAVVSGARTVRREGIDVIFATGRPWTALVIGTAIKAITGKPLVLDFRDPWMTNPFRLPYSAIKNRIEAIMESRVIGSADAIIANTDCLRDEFVRRFGDTVKEKCVTIINSFDTEEFARIVPAARPRGQEKAFVLTHSGFLYGQRDPRTLLQAIRLLKDRNEIRDGEFLCNLVGSVELSYDLPEYLKEQGIAANVQLIGQVSYAESLAQLAACDVALLLQPGTTTQIPSKLFEYIGLGHRIVTVAPANSAVVKLVMENGLGRVADPEDAEEIAAALKDAIRDWKTSAKDLAIRPEIQAKFEIRQCTARLAEQLDRLSA